MRRFLYLGIFGVGLALAMGVSGSTAQAAIALKLTSPTVSVAPGDSFYVDAEIASDDSLFNAFELVVRYDPAMVTFKPTSPQSNQIGSMMTGVCGSTFHVFNAYPDSVVADVSLLCGPNFVSGPGQIYRLKFQSNGTSGPAKFTAGVTTRFYKAGVYVNPVWAQGVTLLVGNTLAAPGPHSGPRGFLLEAPRPNPARTGGSSAIAFSLPSPARVKLELYDLQGRMAAAREVGDSPAGASLVRWAVPGLAAGRYELRLSADGRVVGRRPWVVLR